MQKVPNHMPQKSSDQVDESLLIDTRTSLLREEITGESSAELRSDSSNRSSLALGEKISYNQKCKIFDSALRKIEIDNFVIFDKVDEFLMMKNK